jgi:hypothetical protein
LDISRYCLFQIRYENGIRRNLYAKQLHVTLRLVGNGSVLFSVDIFSDDDFAAIFITGRANSNQEYAEDAKIGMDSLCLGVKRTQ